MARSSTCLGLFSTGRQMPSFRNGHQVHDLSMMHTQQQLHGTRCMPYFLSRRLPWFPSNFSVGMRTAQTQTLKTTTKSCARLLLSRGKVSPWSREGSSVRSCTCRASRSPGCRWPCRTALSPSGPGGNKRPRDEHGDS